MKKFLAVALTVLMLLPTLATIAFAAFEVPEGTEEVNIAGSASIKVVDTFNQGVVVDETSKAMVSGLVSQVSHCALTVGST